ncbi:MAG: Gfo/Idh/MocA family protein [Flavobacteriaceae bacterium]
MNRRSFLQTSSLSAASVGALSVSCTGAIGSLTERPTDQKYMGDFAAEPLEKVRAAFIGLGYRGKGHLDFFATLEGTEVVALSDLYEDNIDKSLAILEKSDRDSTSVKTYSGDEKAWLQMLEEVRPDVVFISTNWTNHAPMCIESMKRGAHAFVEVPMALTIEELWDVVNTSEKTGKHCMMMENVNYSRDELMFLNMCRQGAIGELLHAEAAYIHELRWQMNEVERGTGSWRTYHYAHRNGNLYPTHGLGPVAQYMNLGRGEDQFKRLTSFSTPARGRKMYAEKNYPEDHKWNALDFKGGDLNTSLIKTHSGRTIMVQWDETSPRPYTRHNLIQGTKGILAGFPTRAAFDGGFEGISEDHHRWIQGENLEKLYEKYDHPLYKRLNSAAAGSGHGGMDGIMMYRIVECLRRGLPLDQNVYEGALWSSVTELSQRSVASDGMPQDFVDFTRGDWKITEPLAIVD